MKYVKKRTLKILHLNGISANFCCFIIGDLSPLLLEPVTNKFQLVIWRHLVHWNNKGICINLHLLFALSKVLKMTIEQMDQSLRHPKSTLGIDALVYYSHRPNWEVWKLIKCPYLVAVGTTSVSS